MIWTIPATVVRVSDGDTIVCDLDLGWHIKLLNQRIRLLHIDAPPRPSSEGQKAYEYLCSLVPVGSSVTVTSHRLDKYGRILGTVALSDDRDLSGLMLAAGLAVPYVPKEVST